jgi:hypothetical protein
MAKKDQEKPLRTESQIRHARDADEEAKCLVEKLRPMNRPEAEAYVRKNRPDVAVIVGMAFYLGNLGSKQPRTDVLKREIVEILRAKPNASTDEVISALRERSGSGRDIADVLEDGTVLWQGLRRQRETTRSAIEKRIARIRKAKKSLFSPLTG